MHINLISPQVHVALEPSAALRPPRPPTQGQPNRKPRRAADTALEGSELGAHFPGCAMPDLEFEGGEWRGGRGPRMGSMSTLESEWR